MALVDTNEDFLGQAPRERVLMSGHRGYVGGQTAEHWYGIGKLQYHYLISEGLRNDHVFLDIACGSLRLGQYLIPYLDRGNYFGIDGERELVDLGLANEFYGNIIQKKAPQFAFNYAFDFSFLMHFDYAIAQSLFTHLTSEDIALCFRNLSKVARAGSRFYFTFFEGDSSDNPDTPSHAQRNWKYSFAHLTELAKQSGWDTRYIGEWQHPRNQMIAVATRLTPSDIKNIVR